MFGTGQCLVQVLVLTGAVSAAGAEGVTTLEGHTDRIESMAFSPDGGTLASASRDQTVRVWDASTGELYKVLTGHPHEDGVYRVAFSPDGKTLASCSGSRLFLWDTSSGMLRLATDKGQMRCVAYSPDGKLLALALSDDLVCLCDPDTAKVLTTLKHPNGPVWSVAFSPDGGLIAAAGGSHGDRNPIALWESATGKQRVSLMEDLGRVYSVAFSPDGRTLASAGMGRILKLWDVPETESAESQSPAGEVVQAVSVPALRPRKMLWGHPDDVNHVTYSPGGKILASGCGWGPTGKLILWDADTGAPIVSLGLQARIG
ncbi:MAG: WD40 repeat domain-containing protein, partial [Planctomycetes bacterium]|nr:WD40 repeat domain-containing protein [Planctomycetota bacterium]